MEQKLFNFNKFTYGIGFTLLYTDMEALTTQDVRRKLYYFAKGMNHLLSPIIIHMNHRKPQYVPAEHLLVYRMPRNPHDIIINMRMGENRAK